MPIFTIRSLGSSASPVRRRLPSALAVLAAISPAVHAEEGSREFSDFVRAAAPAPRAGPVDPLEWERSSRAPDRFGPRPLRQSDVALIAAARARRWAEVTAAINGSKGDVNANDDLGANVLEMAARDGADDVVRVAIRHGALLDRKGEDGLTPLGAAALLGHRSTARILIAAGADLVAWSASGEAPMHLAASAGRTSVVELLLAAGVDPRLADRGGDNALDVAANRGQFEVMERLIAAGVDPSESGR